MVNLEADPDLSRFLAPRVERDKLVIVAGDKASARNNCVAAAKAHGTGCGKTAFLQGDVAEIR